MNPFTDGDIEELLDEEDLPFVRYKLPPEEETLETLRTSEMLISTLNVLLMILFLQFKHGL